METNYFLSASPDFVFPLDFLDLLEEALCCGLVVEQAPFQIQWLHVNKINQSFNSRLCFIESNGRTNSNKNKNIASR